MQPIGVIVIEVDPDKFLYPEILDWPTPSPTGETLLVRREGDEIVFLNKLRHRKGEALSLRLPINNEKLPAAQVVLGRKHFTTGVDYRGVPVLASVRDIPGTPWFIVAKVDQEEVYAPMRERALTTGALVLVLIVLAALGVALMDRGRDARWLRSQLTMEREHRLILDSTDQGVLGLDRHGRHVFINPAACRMLGCAPEELLGKPSHSIWHYKTADGTPCSPEECQIIAVLRTGKSSGSDQEVFWRKDGTSFPVEYTATPSLDKDRPVALVLFFRDITERRRAESNLCLATEVKQVLNLGGDLNRMIDETLRLIRESLGCDAVDLRMRKGEDFPYFEHSEVFRATSCGRKISSAPSEKMGQSRMTRTAGPFSNARVAW